MTPRGLLVGALRGLDVVLGLRLCGAVLSGVLAGGVLRFDFVAPTIGRVDVAGSPVRRGAMATLRFTASEALAADPNVLLEGGAALTKDPSSRGLDYVYVYTASGAEPDRGAGRLRLVL